MMLVLVGLAGYPIASFADWPQFLGPNRNGVSDEKGLAREWPEGGPRVLWSVAVGEGYAGAAVRDGEVYVLDRREGTTDILRCFALNDGNELWNYSYEAPGNVGHTGSRNPPTVDEKYVYSVGMVGDFLCTDRKIHKPAWQKNFIKEFGTELPRWGYSQSPVLYKNLVIVAPQAPDAFIVAYDREKGDLVWKSAGLGRVGYVSPVVVTLAGVEQLVMTGAGSRDGSELGATAGISLDDGSILWKYEGWQCWIPIPNATPLPGDKLFITGGYNAGSAIVQVAKGAGGFEAKEVMKLSADTCGSQIHQPIVYKDHLYVNSNSNERLDGMSCFTLDGALKWRSKDAESNPLFERGNFIIADDLIIALDGKTGILYLVEPSPEGYKQLAMAPVVEGRELWGPLAISDGKLLVRSQDILKCLDLKNPKVAALE